MTRILNAAKILAFASLAFLLIALGVLAVRVGRMAPKLGAAVDQTSAAVANLNAALVEVNRSCGGGHPCGTLADIAKTLGTVRGTAGEIEIAAHHEDRQLGVVDAQERQLYLDAHRSLGHLSEDLVSARATIAALQPAEAELSDELVELQEVSASANALLADPNVTKTAANIASMTDSGKSILADGAYETHKLTHPQKKTGFWVGFWFVIDRLKPPLF